jgi:hypothetical protein
MHEAWAQCHLRVIEDGAGIRCMTGRLRPRTHILVTLVGMGVFAIAIASTVAAIHGVIQPWVAGVAFLMVGVLFVVAFGFGSYLCRFEPLMWIGTDRCELFEGWKRIAVIGDYRLFVFPMRGTADPVFSQIGLVRRYLGLVVVGGSGGDWSAVVHVVALGRARRLMDVLGGGLWPRCRVREESPITDDLAGCVFRHEPWKWRQTARASFEVHGLVAGPAVAGVIARELAERGHVPGGHR